MQLETQQPKALRKRNLNWLFLEERETENFILKTPLLVYFHMASSKRIPPRTKNWASAEVGTAEGYPIQKQKRVAVLYPTLSTSSESKYIRVSATAILFDYCFRVAYKLGPLV